MAGGNRSSIRVIGQATARIGTSHFNEVPHRWNRNATVSGGELFEYYDLQSRVKQDPCYALVIPDDPLRSRHESIGINGLKCLFQVSVMFHVFVSHANDENQPPGLGVRGWPLAIIEDA